LVGNTTLGKFALENFNYSTLPSYSSLGLVVANPFFPFLFFDDFVDPDDSLLARKAIVSRQEGADGRVIWNLTNPVITTNDGTGMLTIPSSSGKVTSLSVCRQPRQCILFHTPTRMAFHTISREHEGISM
jgi:hypothetical protein